MATQKLARELALLSLPLLFLGGVLLWRSRQGEVVLPGSQKEPSRTGPLRLEFSPLQEAELTPYEVSQGYTWKVRTKVQEVGTLQIPANWSRVTTVNPGASPDMRVVYRVGKVWKQAPKLAGGLNLFQGNFDLSTRENFYRANLSTVPPEAEVVQLRGHFLQWAAVRGTLTPGLNLPIGTRHFNQFHEIPVKSLPFSVEIKGENEPLPQPVVSREPTIELRGHTFSLQSERDPKGVLHNYPRFFLHLHHTQDRNWGQTSDVILSNAHLFDANGHEIPFFRDVGKGRKVKERDAAFRGGQSQEWFSLQKASDDLVVNVFDWNIAPKQPWTSYKQPLRVQVDVSDGTCWPTRVTASFDLSQPPGDLKEFAAPAST